MIWLSLALLSSPALSAQTTEERLQRLERAWAPVDPDFRYGALGPVLSKVYRGDELGVRLGLSSEFFTLATGTLATADDPAGTHANVLGVAPTLAYRPHERLYFDAQVLFGNGGAETSDTVALRKGGAVVRVAYLDWTFARNSGSGVRLGHQLVPLGRTNTDVDALTWFGVRRPPVERDLLPADWHENGMLAYWNRAAWSAELGVFSSLDARGLRAETFLSGGTSQGQNAPSADLMAVGRVNASFGNLALGASVATGATAQGDEALPPGQFRLAEARARYRRPRLDFEAQVAGGRLEDAGLIGLFNQTPLASATVADSVSAGVRLLPPARPAVWAFARAAHVDLAAEMPSGVAKDARRTRREAQLGLHYLPLPTLVTKVDATRVAFGDGTSHLEFWLGAGFVF